jgi:hypothetical protein
MTRPNPGCTTGAALSEPDINLRKALAVELVRRNRVAHACNRIAQKYHHNPFGKQLILRGVFGPIFWGYSRPPWWRSQARFA